MVSGDVPAGGAGGLPGSQLQWGLCGAQQHCETQRSHTQRAGGGTLHELHVHMYMYMYIHEHDT